MLTVRQIQRLWGASAYGELVRSFLQARPENSLRLSGELSRQVPAAALAVILLDEWGQSYHPFCGKLIRTILAAQEADGGFGDAMVTALCLRALLCSNGQGPAVERAIAYLVNLQRPEGLWPRVPLRRMPADAFVSAFVLLHLGNDARFQAAVAIDRAINWFDANRQTLEPEAAKLWRAVSIRICHAAGASWS